MVSIRIHLAHFRCDIAWFNGKMTTVTRPCPQINFHCYSTSMFRPQLILCLFSGTSSACVVGQYLTRVLAKISDHANIVLYRTHWVWKLLFTAFYKDFYSMAILHLMYFRDPPVGLPELLPGPLQHQRHRHRPHLLPHGRYDMIFSAETIPQNVWIIVNHDSLIYQPILRCRDWRIFCEFLSKSTL